MTQGAKCVGMHNELHQLFLGQHVLTLRDHPSLRGQLRRAEAAGDVVRLLPGTWALTEAARRLDVRALAACRYSPTAVVVGEAAAHLTYGRPASPGGSIGVVGRGPQLPGYHFLRHSLASADTVRLGELRLSAPAWTAMDLALTHGSAEIDTALRCGVPLSELHAAASALSGRRGMSDVRRWLEESRQRPWSPAERTAQRILREGGVTGWVGNFLVRLPTRAAFLDIALPALMLGFEIDGYEHHSARRSFVHDRNRDAELAAHGWQVVRHPASLVSKEPGRFLGLVKAVIARRQAG